MKKLLIPALAGFLVAGVVAGVFGFLGARLHDPVIAESGRLLAAALGCALSFLLYMKAGNRRVATADESRRSHALEFACPPDKALIYLIRTGFKGNAIGVDIQVDGHTVAQLRSPMFTCIEVAPGSHSIAAEVGGNASALHPAPARHDAALAAGSITLLHIGMKMQLTRSQLVFEPWALDAAKAKLGSIRMVLPQPLAA